MREPLRSWTKDDFDVEWFSGQGAGGQHRNKHQNCLRLRDRETGITVVAQGHRSRKANMREALKTMADRLVAHHYPQERRERAPSTEHVRTYNEAENRVVDIASGEKFLRRGFDIGEAIDARRLALAKEAD